MIEICEAEKKLIQDISNTFEYGRLNRISFLGIIDHYNSSYMRDSTSRYTRRQHSDGVLYLLLRLLDQIKTSYNDRRILISVALCHDMGHSPFSHSVEHAFKKIDNTASHKNTLKKILHDNETELSITLRKHQIDIQRLLSLSNGTNSNDVYFWIFHCPMNVDTVDGIDRFFRTYRLDSGFQPRKIMDILARLHNSKAISEAETKHLDSFWHAKSIFYEKFLIDTNIGKLENNFVRHMVEKIKDVKVQDFYIFEEDLLKELNFDEGYFYEHPSGQEHIKPQSRFVIDKKVILTSIEDLEGRYVRIRNE